jgi:hypothetical protein
MRPFTRAALVRRVRPLVTVAAVVATSAGCGAEKPVRSGAGCSPARSDVSCSVLFLGNSYTAANNLPGVFSELAASSGLTVVAHARAPGGTTLADHVAASDTAAMFASDTLNVVVMQEQSQIPASPDLVATNMLPAATELTGRARRVGAEPLLLETWARREGWPEIGITTYADMQTAINGSYAGVGKTLRAGVAPVGEAWARSLANPALPDLWQADGSHPTVAGTYLAACVLFATIFDRSPQGLAYHEGISSEAAAELQAAAWAVAH